jgi:hypothetical protein
VVLIFGKLQLLCDSCGGWHSVTFTARKGPGTSAMLFSSTASLLGELYISEGVLVEPCVFVRRGVVEMGIVDRNRDRDRKHVANADKHRA